MHVQCACTDTYMYKNSRHCMKLVLFFFFRNYSLLKSDLAFNLDWDVSSTKLTC